MCCVDTIDSLFNKKMLKLEKKTNHIDTLKFPDILCLFYTETSIFLLIRKVVSPKKGL